MHLGDAPRGVPTHAFCGEHQIAVAQCPQRKHPLLRLLSVVPVICPPCRLVKAFNIL